MRFAAVNVLHSIVELAELPGPIFLAIGVFDGVHLGHRAVIEHALRAAEAAGGTPVALTFDPHPAAILRPEQAPALLTSTRHKLRLLGQLGVAHALVADFTLGFAATPPEDFISKLAETARSLRQICVGENWAFGKGRKGDLALLRKLGDALGFEAVGLPAIAVDGTPVSSTGIRSALEAGDLDLARRMLGRDFSVLGKVIEGRKLGRTLGFPTANLRPESEQLPPNGVYAVRVIVDPVAAEGTGRAVQTRNAQSQTPNEKISPPPSVVGYCGVANIGVRPTVSPQAAERVVEVHLFDFSGDLYDHDLEVSLLQFLRPEKKFPNLDALRDQIAADIESAQSILRV